MNQARDPPLVRDRPQDGRKQPRQRRAEAPPQEQPHEHQRGQKEPHRSTSLPAGLPLSAQLTVAIPNDRQPRIYRLTE